MAPDSFTFKLTVPNDPEGATVLAVVVTHAVEYATIDAAAGTAFVERVRAAALEALKGASGPASLAVVAAKDGQLTVTIGSESISQPLPS
jgi:hypothetical protein